MNEFQRELRVRLNNDSLALSEHELVAKATFDHPSFEALELGQYVDQYAAILFLDIRGWTRLSMKLPLGDTARVLDAVVSTSAVRLRHYGAHINDFPGDGIMAVFAEENYGTRGQVDARALFAVSHLMAEMSGFDLREELLRVGAKEPVQVAIGMYAGVVRWQRVGPEGCSRVMALGEVAPLAAKYATSEHTASWQTMVGGSIADSIPPEFRTKQKDFVKTFNGEDMHRSRYLLDTSGMFNAMPGLIEAQALTSTARSDRAQAAVPPTVPVPVTPSVQRKGSGDRAERGIG